jgi:23S rRNA (guanine2535-N1)-methyltransferase
MPYRFSTERVDYSDFASGRVFRSLPGRTAFPVRLADELFQRCLARRAAATRDRPVVLYDPCCGGASLLCTLALQHWPRIGQIVASDADQEAVALAARNLALLTPVGLAERRRELAELYADYGRSSHADAVASVDRLAARVRDLGQDHPLQTRLFRADALDEADLGAHLEPESIDIMIVDVPYGRRTRWLADHAHDAAPDLSGPTPVWRLLDALRPFLAAAAVVAVVTDKSQRARHERYAPAGTFQIGKRRASLLTLV